MSNLQTLVESIVTDLISARFEADVKSAELAEHYREHPILRTMAVPTLNISNVTVDLRVAFDEGKIEAEPGPSEAQKRAVSQASSELRTSILSLKSVSDKVTVARQKSALSRSLQSRTAKIATEKLAESPTTRRAEVEKQINELLSANRVNLSAADKKKVAVELSKFEQTVAAAPKASPSVPDLLIGAEKLATIPPEAVTSIKFDIDLAESRWVETTDSAGNVHSILTDR